MDDRRVRCLREGGESVVSGRRRDSIVTRYYLDENGRGERGERERRREGKKWNADPLKSLDTFIKREVRRGSLDISINRTINVLPTAMPPGKIIKRMNPHVIGKSSLMQLCFFPASLVPSLSSLFQPHYLSYRAPL